MEKRKIAKVWVDETHIYASTTDGLVASYSFAQWPRLANGTAEQRGDFFLSYGGIHWPQLDEDLSFEGMFHQAGVCNITPSEDSVFYDVAEQEMVSSLASEPSVDQ